MGTVGINHYFAKMGLDDFADNDLIIMEATASGIVKAKDNKGILTQRHRVTEERRISSVFSVVLCVSVSLCEKDFCAI